MTGLPTGWKSVALGTVCEPILKINPISTGRQSIRYVDIGSIDGSTHRLTAVSEIAASDAPTRARQLVAEGDTVFATVRPYLEKIAYIDVGLNAEFASTGFCVLRPNAAVDSRYLFHFATSRALLDQVLPLQRGVSYPAVRDNDIFGATIPVPPLAEQRRIVYLLENHLSRLDAATRNIHSASARATTLLSLAAHRAVSGASLAPGDEQIRFGALTLPVPAGWRASTVGAEAVLVEYGTSAKTSQEVSAQAVPVLRMGNIREGCLNLDKLAYLPHAHPDAQTRILQTGDLLFNRTNSAELVGKSAVFDIADRSMTFASYLLRVRFGASVRPAWANMLINSPLGRAYISSVASQQVGQSNVNGTKLKQLPLLIPPVATQGQLVGTVGDLRYSTRRVQDAGSAASARGAALRVALLQAAFLGQLNGRSSDLERAEESVG